MKKTLLLVFIHGFKGTDDTFANFPSDLRALLSHTLPKIEIQSVQYPRYETRGDLKAAVARFKEWLQNKVIDIEVANRTPSPTVDPSVHVVLCGHSMGGIVAAETLLSIAKEEPISSGSSHANDTANSTAPSSSTNSSQPTQLDSDNLPSSTPPVDPTRLFFPYVQAIIAFDTPYLGISPGVLAHGAEEHINQASSAYKAFESSSSLFGWKSPRSGSASPIPDAANRGLPAPGNGTNSPGGGAWSKWGKYAAFGGAAAAIAGAAGAAYLNRNQISQGFAWAGSHLEFVGCLARGAELQRRVESVVQLTKTHGVGFADFYTALGEKVTSQTKYSGSVLGSDRTFCVVPKSVKGELESPTGSKRDRVASGRSTPNPSQPPLKSQKPAPPGGAQGADSSPLNDEMHNGEQVQQYAEDTSKSKGRWVKCVNEAVSDELKAHTSMFSPRTNPNYHSMRDAARDEIVRWVVGEWYESSAVHEEKEEEGWGTEKHEVVDERWGAQREDAAPSGFGEETVLDTNAWR